MLSFHERCLLVPAPLPLPQGLDLYLHHLIVYQKMRELKLTWSDLQTTFVNNLLLPFNTLGPAVWDLRLLVCSV